MAGRPNELFYLPDLHGGINRLQTVTDAQIHKVYENCVEAIEKSDQQEYLECAAASLAIQKPFTWRDALANYRYLVSMILE